jgi:hypothetical protein
MPPCAGDGDGDGHEGTWRVHSGIAVTGTPGRLSRLSYIPCHSQSGGGGRGGKEHVRLPWRLPCTCLPLYVRLFGGETTEYIGPE